MRYECVKKENVSFKLWVVNGTKFFRQLYSSLSILKLPARLWNVVVHCLFAKYKALAILFEVKLYFGSMHPFLGHSCMQASISILQKSSLIWKVGLCKHRTKRRVSSVFTNIFFIIFRYLIIKSDVSILHIHSLINIR